MRWRRIGVVGEDAAKDASQRVAPRVAETLMPDIGGEGGVGVKVAVGRGHADGVQIGGGITSEDHPLGSPVLKREAKVVKLNIYRVITT